MKHAWLITLILLVCSARTALAHARIKPTGELAPRSNSAGLKTGPCGGVPASATYPSYDPNAALRVDWEETIDHPGRYEFYLSMDGGVSFNLLQSIEDTQNTSVAGTPHQYTTTITLPATGCEHCVLQMIQVMTEDPQNPSYYYSCADLRIKSGAPPDGQAAPACKTGPAAIQ